jgi:hypothetical protein
MQFLLLCHMHRLFWYACSLPNVQRRVSFYDVSCVWLGVGRWLNYVDRSKHVVEWTWYVLISVYHQLCWRPQSIPLRTSAPQRNWQPQRNRDFLELLSDSWIHVSEWSNANWGNGNATRGETEKLNFQAPEHATLPTVALPCGFLVFAVLLRASVIHLFVKVARKVDEAANFVFVQLIEQEPFI